MTNHEKIYVCLERHLLKNVVPLKMLAAYAHGIEAFHAGVGEDEGVLLLLETAVSPFDAATYPASDKVVLLASHSPTVTESLVQHIPTNKNLVCKLCQEADKEIIAQRIPLQRQTAYLSFTAPQHGSRHWSIQEAVVISQAWDEQLMPLFAQNHYTQEEVAGFFAAAQTWNFAIFNEDKPVCACLAYKNYDAIWEIGALYTLPEYRQQGLAQQVIETAVSTLLAHNLIPRYQIREDNIASRKLAEKLGLQQFLTTTHYLHHVRTAVDISIAAPEDSPELVRILKAAFMIEAKRYHKFDIPPLLETEENFAASFANLTIYKAEQNGKIVGSVNTRVENNTCYIGRLVVDPEIHNQGVGKQLMARAEADNPHVSRFELYTGYRSEKNIRFYEKQGYKIYDQKMYEPDFGMVFMEKFQ